MDLAGAEREELAGEWRAAQSDDDLRRAMSDADFDDSAWANLPVPGHWANHPGFVDADGPVIYRRRFEAEPPAGDQRSFLTFDGIFYQSDIWLDGEYVGDTEGYFQPHTFEVTAALQARRDHVLGVEVACAPPGDLTSKRNLTGVFQHWDCIDPAWNPGGIWAGVHIDRTGSVRIRSLKVLCREANNDRATLDLEADLDAAGPTAATVITAVNRDRDPDDSEEQGVVTVAEEDLAAGTNVIRWTVVIDRPDLWWPHALGGQPLYRVQVEVHLNSDPDRIVRPGEPASDRRELLTGLRQIKVRNFIATVNGERFFLKGANLGPTDRAPGEVPPGHFARDVRLAADAGLDLLRIHAHISTPELYEAADRHGMLIWQDLPLQWGYGQVRRQAVTQARHAVTMLGHHPSIALWCGHNEPMAVAMTPGTAVAARTVARVVAAQVLPSWNKTALDRSIRRALERADGTREVVAHSGILPHPAWGTDSHFYFGWYHGRERDFPRMLARLPVLARFVSEFGAQAVPETDGFMEPQRWPDLDWEHLEQHFCLQKSIFDERVPPADHPSFDAWRRATQRYQSTVVRHHVEALRRLKYRPCGGFCVFMLADAQPAVSWALLDHERRPKDAYGALAEACAPVIITADRPNPMYRVGDRVSLDLHAVSDLRQVIAGASVRAILSWPGGMREWRFTGDIPADSCSRVGRISQVLDQAGSGPLLVELAMEWDGGGRALNSYRSRIE